MNMINSSKPRLHPSVAAAVAATLLTSVSTAAPSQVAVDTLTRRGPANEIQLPAHALANSAIAGVLNPGALSAPILRLTLANGQTIEARQQRVAIDDRKGTRSWIGTFADAPGSVLVLSKAKGVVTGFGNYREHTIEIQPDGLGKHIMFAVDNARLPQIEKVDVPQLTVADAMATVDDFGTGGATPDATANAVHQVLVVYTAASASRHGQATLESMIQSSVQAANQAYLNSGVPITMNLAGAQQVSITEGTSMSITKSALQSDPAVAKLRDQLAADVVMLVSQNSEYCGLANLMTSNSTGFGSNAYGVIYSSCLSNQSLAHEVGHVQGITHDRANAGSRGAYAYSYGYRVCVSDGTGFRDIMSYSCSGAPRVLLFSNPSVTYNGHAAGVSYELDPANSAENSRTLVNTANTVAAFRDVSTSGTSATSAPTSPSGLIVKSATYMQVDLGWTDNSTNETGFKLERSRDGVSYSEIATLGVDTKSFSDLTTSTLQTFYYRVRAYNSGGVSAYSSVARATTPDVPPLPPTTPTSVAALNNSDGTATVSWTPGDDSATSFEVRRESWNSRKGTWGSAVTAATVPNSVKSIVDAAGSGTYRYFVRAANIGGVSGNGGPSQITVTGGTMKGKSGR